MTQREYLRALEAERGFLTPALVLEAARPNDSPIHAFVFDRPPAEAAEAWYLEKAQRLIQKLRVEYRPADGKEPVSMREFYAIPTSDGEYVYQSYDRVAADPFLSRLAIQEAEREWKQLKRKHAHLPGFFQMVQSDIEPLKAAA